MSFQNYIMFYILVYTYTGMRKGELVALEWKDINLEEKSIRINKTNVLRRRQRNHPNG
ncbi:hypothetical protein D7Z54_32805 [Salibacterium salarium]|uniref:Tyr recombinase domain-containing protein n=2 Tax=Salibacterium salarium TaxID=284579 RepID=A0A428MSM4_9BACI|nr:tyrosine-type recombinase/integrase [Salibacterium salarium]RSL29141.1 hypothetical protein D7Z54_32805 [Salibacterium salarium]